MSTKFPFFNFLVSKIYLGMWAHRARGYVEHVGTLGTPFSRLYKLGVFENFAKVTGRHLCWNLLLIILQA